MADIYDYGKKMVLRDRRRLTKNETIVKFRLNHIEKMNLYNEATMRGMTFSQFLREAVNKYTKKNIFSSLREEDGISEEIIQRGKNSIRIITEKE